MKIHMARPGFTLIEILVVIAIIGVLAALSMSGLSMLQKQFKTTATTNTMNSIVLAMQKYLAEEGVPGDLRDANSSDFCAKPWEYLGRRQIIAGLPPLLELKTSEILETNGSGWTRTTNRTSSAAAKIADAFGRPFIFQISNDRRTGDAPGTYTYSQWISITSDAGTPGRTSDDIIFGYGSATAAFRRIQ
jgi:prepilin-type N-terminal cleavage/methylation domain-containing protein